MSRETISFATRYGPWALVAGASEGIGEAFARELARRGLDLVLLARGEARLRATAAEISDLHGVRVHAVALDLGQRELPARLAAAIGEREVGLLIYNAAYAPRGEFLDQTLEDKLQAIDVNCRGPVVLCHLLGEAMRERGRGGIVLMGSLAGMQGSPKLATYAATKAFNLVLGESLWGELDEAGVDVLACIAGATRTPGFERTTSRVKGPVMEPADVVEEALASLGRRPSVTAGAANKLASLAMSSLPRRRRILIMKGAVE